MTIYVIRRLCNLLLFSVGCRNEIAKTFVLAASGACVGSITFGVKALFGYVEYLPPDGKGINMGRAKIL